MNKKLLIAATALSVTATQPWSAFAQESTAPSKATASAGAVEEILVTARRREESITSVPISVNALSSAALQSQGVVRVDDLQRSTPALKMSPTAGRRTNSQYEIRGLATVESLITEDPAVGVYVNDVYRARATGTNQSLFDIDNVQVLYGPQGTLFGRNTSAGAILINTKKPVIGRFEGNVEAGYGNYNAYHFGAALNVPVSDKIAIRVAGQREKRDGYGTNLTTGHAIADQDTWGGRVSILFKPSDNLENLTVASLFTGDEAGSLVIPYGYRPCPGPIGATAAPAASCSATLSGPLAAAVTAQRSHSVYQTAYDPSLADYRGVPPTTTPDPFEITRNYSLTNSTTYNINDNLVVKNIFGYNYTKLRASTDLDGTPTKLIDTYYDTKNNQLTEELQLQGTADRFNWVVGAMYFRERGRDIQNSVQTVVASTKQNLLGINTSYALFLQGTYKLTDRLSFTAGGRYSWDKRRAIYDHPTTQIGAGAVNCTFPAAIAPTCYIELNQTFSEPTYTVSLDYKLTDDSLVYVANRRGYRSGGLPARVATVGVGLSPFAPETVEDIEIGAKGNFSFEGGARLRPSIALYKAWYKNIQRQVTVLTGLASPATTTAITNAANADVQGLEATIGFNPIKGIEIDAFWGYVDGNYGKFVNGATTFTNLPFANAKNTLGFTLLLTPIDNESFGRLTLATNYSYRSSYYGDQSLPTLEPESLVPAQKNVNMSLTWDEIAGTSISAEAWMHNVTNQVHILGVTALSSSFGVSPAIIGEPRMYGMTLKYKFGS